MRAAKRKLAVVMIALIVILTVIGYFILPDTVVIQVHADGTASNTVSKAAALIIPVILTTAGALAYCTDKKGNESKWLIVAIAGYAVSIISFIVN